MAEASSSGSASVIAEEVIVVSSDSEDDTNAERSVPMECPICLQTCIHPARLPCGHIFCFLCVKGVAYKNRRCAMCRREIPVRFLEHPQLVNGVEDLFKSTPTDDGYQWYYEGRNGWWQYDERTTQDIEEAYKKGEKSCTILVAGYVYAVDFDAMLQQRQNDMSRRRRVKRDLDSIPKKGVAGLRIDEASNVISVGDETDEPIHNIRPVTITDTAIRIASDIIDSTLAHAEEYRSETREGSGDRSAGNSGTLRRELLDEVEDTLNISTVSYHRPSSDFDSIFSQTLEDFRSLTLTNVIDSSDSEDEISQLL